MTLLALMLAGALLSSGEQQSSNPPPQSDAPASIDRIRERLQRPSAIQMPREPDFRVTIEEDAKLRKTALDMLREELSGEAVHSLPWPLSRAGQQIVGVDLLQLALSVKNAISGARRAHAERSARSEVDAALREFCAQHDCSVLEQELKQSRPEGVLTH